MKIKIGTMVKQKLFRRGTDDNTVYRHGIVVGPGLFEGYTMVAWSPTDDFPVASDVYRDNVLTNFLEVTSTV